MLHIDKKGKQNDTDKRFFVRCTGWSLAVNSWANPVIAPKRNLASRRNRKAKIRESGEAKSLVGSFIVYVIESLIVKSFLPNTSSIVIICTCLGG